ncbi:Uncharacterized protein involved in outer membrane biogenesis [Fodinibius salinus]|uniref:Uncharacterized protein involved in outer membrane biogenesis n=1 Tax=Fodinibius salinus TaxID=860790 RepID=A0A5D3YPG6_9BACT|nr:hypothetical protein [Fodinibius salinus]TYP94929.1 Uncharacterized protein involved in outer membrane biogenesis [Fodinibius salinus]
MALLLVILIVGGCLIGVLQLDVTQNYLVDNIEQRVEQNFHAKLEIGDVGGFLPFNISMQDVVLVNTYSASEDTVASVQNLTSQIAVWGLLQNELAITGFRLDKPRLWIRSDEEGRRRLLIPKKDNLAEDSKSAEEGWFSSVEIVAPALEITDGTLHLTAATKKNKIGNLPQSFALTDIEASFFLEWGGPERYFDVSSFSANTKNLGIDKFSLSGQLYSDQNALEFNSFYVNLADSRFILNGQVQGVDITQPDLTGQLAEARYNISVESERFELNDLRDIIPNTPSWDPQFSLQVEADGTTDSLAVTQASIGTGESFIRFKGFFKHLKQQNFSYDVTLDSVNLRKPDVYKFADTLSTSQYRALQDLSASGEASGSANSVDVDLQLQNPMGRLTVNGQSQLRAPYNYSGTISAKKLNIAPLITTWDTTSLNINSRFEGQGISLEEASGNFEVSLADSYINNIGIDTLWTTAELSDGLFSHHYEYSSGDEHLSGSGTVDVTADKSLSLEGDGQNFNIKKYLESAAVVSTSLNFDYNVEFQNFKLDDIYGRVNVDIHPSIVGEDSVKSHQFYADLNAPGNDNRSLRLTSSVFDMNISGDILPSDIVEQYQFWMPYLRSQFRTELLLDTEPAAQPSASALPDDPVVVEGNITAKNLSLIKKYIPDFPSIYSNAELTFSTNTSAQRFLLSANMQADSLNFNNWTFTDSQTQFTASARSDQSLKEFTTVDWETSVGTLDTPRLTADSLVFDFALNQDSVYYSQTTGSIAKNTQFQMDVEAALTDTAISVTVPNFYLGNQEYAWQQVQTPSFTYNQKGQIQFNDFRFQNRDEYLRLQGTFSKNRSDSLTYILEDIHLNRISDLIKGQINFNGVLNGTFVTRSLTRQPTVQGKFDINSFKLNNRLIGDVDFNSEYNPDKKRFDTQIDIQTDSTKYQDYLASNDGIGQDIQLDGYVLQPDANTESDSLYYFDASFKQIDMWVLPLFLDNIFQNMEGQATGDGYITGNFDDIDFHANFETKNVFAKPQFVNTNYFLTGPVILDRDEGVTLDSLNVIDTKGGSGTVWGNIDFNDFSPITYIDLTMDMNRLQFLNNKRDPDVPFFGNASGSGILRLTGSNQDMYMRTPGTLQLSSSSEMSIPLLEETELQETGKFIQFVETFEPESTSQTEEAEEQAKEATVDEEALREEISDMTFTERFDLDLQFEANENVTVNLLFDPVTGEVLTAGGTGQLNITMQDQDLQMFGRYTINNGNYQFVTGEIISRNFQLQPGGTIIWEGPADNARLDISAVYNARPNIATLTSQTAFDAENENTSQQVPIELVLEITGTLNSVENNFFFRLPSSIDLSSNSTLQYTINQINRDDQQKLLQATSILFSGQFIPSRGASNSTASLSQNLTRGSTVINPLLSNQVISPLLSNQINALLNSDVSELEVDFNLNANNEVDLGIALRLYNDRLILRREGQLTGQGSESSFGDRIGDLNATYRINRGLSLTAFHRQDQVLNSYSASGSQAGDVTPSVDGIGIETQVQYNTWGELMRKIRNIFGNNENENKNKKSGERNETAQKPEEGN